MSEGVRGHNGLARAILRDKCEPTMELEYFAIQIQMQHKSTVFEKILFIINFYCNNKDGLKDK